MTREEKILKSLNLKNNEYLPPDGAKSARFLIKDDYDDKLFNFLKNRFGITNETHFRTKFKQAISGDGDEAKKMASVRSSSLCALLCFYNVEEKPITFLIDNKKVKFNKSFFEVKNKVYNNPSNMDVVLISEDNKHILFIESKFAEYLDNGAIEISDTYRITEPSKTIYDKALTVLFNENSGKYKTTKNYQYMGGLKQIISHYVGLQNYKKREDGYMVSYYENGDERLSIYESNNRIIHFTEIVFKLKDFEKEYDNYHSGSTKLFEMLAKEDHDIDYLMPIDYKTLFSVEDNKDCLSEEIRAYYLL